ncbi:MAG: A24 family peptidase [Firmicutes bacterium]|nr:A24 family peptidase [Bacillota bacterium]
MTELNLINIIELVAAGVAGFFAGLFIVFAFNRLPAQWLCDYDEEPSQELKDPNVKRIKENPWRWICAAGFVCIGLRLVSAAGSPGNLQLALAGMFACWLLAMIGIADAKYMIIPDQFVGLLALSTIGFIPVHKALRQSEAVLIDNMMWDLLTGLAIGGGVMLAAAGIGALITKKESVGFGDVKLCAAIGLMLGVAGIATTLVLGLLASGLYATGILVTGRAKKDDAMPLGPFLCCGAFTYIIIVVPFLLMYN